MEVKFYDEVEDNLISFAVIITKHKGMWVFCKHKDRDTLEVPGGHRESGEDIFDTAKRELYEETGALEFIIEPVCIYSISDKGQETYGKLFYSEIFSLEKELHSEIEKLFLSDVLPENWTYPLIQPKLMEKIRVMGY